MIFLPLTVLEAMSFGKCVVTSDADRCGDSFNNPAYEKAVVFQNRSDVELTETLRTLKNAPQLLAKMGNAAKAFVAANHSWEFVAQRFADIYRSF